MRHRRAKVGRLFEAAINEPSQRHGRRETDGNAAPKSARRPRRAAIRRLGAVASVAVATASVMVVALAGAVPARALSNTGTHIPISGGPWGIAITPDGGQLYVSSAYAPRNKVSVVDTSSNTVTATIHVGSAPRGIAIAPDGEHVYVANSGLDTGTVSNTVSVIDTSTNKVTDTITVGDGPFGVAVSPDGGRVYVANLQGNSVSVIDTASNTVIATVPVGATPHFLAVTPDGQYVYVTNNGSSSVAVVATSTNTVVATVPVGSSPNGVAVTPDGKQVFVANTGSDTVSVIDTAANSVTRTVAIPKVENESRPYDITCTTTGDYCFVTGEDDLAVINTSTYVTANRRVYGGPTNIVLTSDDKHAYITVNNAAEADPTGVVLLSRTITQTAPNSATVTYGQGYSSQLGTSGATGSVTFTTTKSADPVTVSSSGEVSAPTMTPVGTYTISGTDLSQAGDRGTWTFTLSVLKAPQSIEFTSSPPTDATTGGPTYEPTAKASSGLPVTLSIDPSSSSVCSMDAGTVSFTATGTCVIDADQPGNDNWKPAPTAQQKITVGKGNQTITFTSTAPAGKAAVAGTGSYEPAATASSGLPVAFSIDPSSAKVCALKNGTVSFTDSGTCVIDADQPGNDNWNPAPTIHQSIKVAPPLTISGTLPSGTVGTKYHATLHAAGGVSPYTWKLTDGALPDGLRLASDGTISGTPTKAGTFEFRVSVDDPVTHTYRITIRPVPSATRPRAPSSTPPLANTGIGNIRIPLAGAVIALLAGCALTVGSRRRARGDRG